MKSGCLFITMWDHDLLKKKYKTTTEQNQACPIFFLAKSLLNELIVVYKDSCAGRRGCPLLGLPMWYAVALEQSNWWQRLLCAWVTLQWSQSWLAAWSPQSAEHQRWAWLLATKAVAKPCFHPLKAALTFDILNNGSETTPVKRKNNGVLTNGTKTDSDWPFRSEKKLRQSLRTFCLLPRSQHPAVGYLSKMVDPLYQAPWSQQFCWIFSSSL